MASTVHRQETLAGLKSFNARRKLKAAMQAARLIAKNSLLRKQGGGGGGGGRGGLVGGRCCP